MYAVDDACRATMHRGRYASPKRGFPSYGACVPSLLALAFLEGAKKRASRVEDCDAGSKRVGRRILLTLLEDSGVAKEVHAEQDQHIRPAEVPSTDTLT